MNDASDARVTVIPVTPEHAEAIRDGWIHAACYPLFLVTNGAEYLVEGPEERWDNVLDDEDEHACLRVFIDHEDAATYCELQRESYGATEEECQVVRATMEQLFGLLDIIQSNSIADYDATARIDICSMRDGEFPKCIDTLFSPTAYIH